MPKISKECIDAALEGLSSFTHDDMHEYATQVYRLAKSYDDAVGVAAINKATKEINNKKLNELFQQSATTAKNITKFNRLEKKIRDKKANLRELIGRRHRLKAGNVEASQHAAVDRLNARLYDAINKEEMNFLIDSRNQYDIARAVDGKQSSPMAKKIADNIKKYMEYRNSEMVVSTALPLEHINGDRWLRQIHDRSRLMSGGISLVKAATDKTKRYTTKHAKDMWRNFIKQHLNIDKTFSETKAMDLEGKIDIKIVDEMLDKIFDNIANDYGNIFTRSGVMNDREAIARKSRMFFHFKDFESMLKYNEQYGKGDLFRALNSDVHGSGNKIGMAELFGDSPYNTYLDLKKVETEVNPRDKPYQSQSRWMQTTDHYFNQVMGGDKVSVSPSQAAFFANIRSVTSMARLPKITIQSLSDIGYISSFSQRYGMSYFKSYTHYLSNLFNLIPMEERTYIAGLFKTNIDSHLGYMGRFVEAHNASDIVDKVSTGFFKINGLEAFDRGNKISMLHLMAKHLGNMSKKSFNELPDALRKQLDKFELTEHEWDVLRRKNERGLFTTDNVNKLTNDDLKSIYEKSDKSVSLYEMKNDLYRKVYSIFDVASENAVLSPSVFTKAWCFRGTSPGTYEGDFLRAISQFKMYTINYIDRVLVEGWKDADSATAKLIWATQMMLGTLPLASLGMALDYWFKGQSIPDPNQMNLHDKQRFLTELVAPSLGLFMGILDRNGQNSTIVLSALTSPSVTFLGNALTAPFSLALGHPERAAKQMKDALNYVLPIQTTPLLSPIIRNMLGEEAHLQPGQIQYYGS